MIRLLRGSATVRQLALLLLLWVGFDVGLHGFAASDYATVASSTSITTIEARASGASAGGGFDHCFCHSLSVGAVTPLRAVFLAPIGEARTPTCPPPPHADRHPLDRPPRLAA